MRLLQPARDDVGVADSVLKLTAIILLLRPFDIWWVAPFVLAAACLSLITRGVRRAPITWLFLAMVAEIVEARHLGHDWFELLGSPDSALRNVLMIAWIVAPALFARKGQGLQR